MVKNKNFTPFQPNPHPQKTKQFCKKTTLLQQTNTHKKKKINIHSKNFKYLIIFSLKQKKEREEEEIIII
jgi:hypothetical protein